MSGIRDRRRDPRTSRRSLRISLVLPVLIAALTLTALWGWAGSALVSESLKLSADADRAESIGPPTHDLITALQDERRLTAAWQTAGDSGSLEALEEARATTGDATQRFRSARSGLDSASATIRSLAGQFDGSLVELSPQREAIDSGELAGIASYQLFTNAIGEAITLMGAAARIDDPELAYRAIAVTELARGSEAASRQDALLYLADGDDADEEAVVQSYAQALALQHQARTGMDPTDLPSSQIGAFENLVKSQQIGMLIAVESLGGGGVTVLPTNPDAWREAADMVGSELHTLSGNTLDNIVDSASSRSTRLLIGAIVGTVLVLAALACALYLCIRYTQSLLRRIAALRATTEELTETTLPELIERLGREGQTKLPETDDDEEKAKAYGDDELGQLAKAFQQQRQQVLKSVVQQARRREGSETVFLGLARRTQILINRIIPKLDKLEREQQDSRLLKEIFAVDHLATRVRRHTENLLILGGAVPGRRWGEPVPIYEVMRSAISETEDYSRVDAPPAPRISLTGRAVADVVHLLAELIENGTSFSPPDTKVSVSAQTVARGRVAVEIIDRGLGMAEAEYTRLNQLLADPPKLDMMALGEAPRLGLFVVARLARRHGLEVVLRSSPYGGTLAVVLIPNELLEEGTSVLSGIVSEAHAASLEAAATKQETTQAFSAIAGGANGGQLIGSGLEPAPTSDAERPARDERDLARAEDREPAHASDGGHEFGGREQSVPPQRDSMASLSQGSLVETEALPHPPAVYDDSGYPAYGGAGLLPSTPTGPEPRSGAAAPSSTPGQSPANSPISDPGTAAPRRQRPSGPPSRTVPSGSSIDKTVERAEDMPRAHADITSPAPEAPSQPGDGSKAGLKLPVRVRGERLAEQLRKEAHLRPGQDDEESSRPRTPGRAGATMAAIQSGNKRARATPSAPSAEGHDPQAQPAGYDADAEGTARKDQR
ncbi:sensor histidine kinase [Streptomyces profundus]|uniref:sensor histidine kinase n=1 Tax=Streptomyces profundus TaxID=2867410 RepID=UPI001D164343|nr:nitrate- and nitrite sensing domain-containing protein [Streptomyces sp. MA3_2.13]UED86158.1 nitrate- and nitrite sensing domain-containing protein [Streptomyces sp. MA3_2.13]